MKRAGWIQRFRELRATAGTGGKESTPVGITTISIG
jgi:hypothetical protein